MPSSSGMRMSEMTSGASPMRSSTPSASRPVPASKQCEPLRLEHPDERAPHAGLVIDDQAVGGAGHDRRRAWEFRHV